MEKKGANGLASHGQEAPWFKPYVFRDGACRPEGGEYLASYPTQKQVEWGELSPSPNACVKVLTPVPQNRNDL